MSAVLSPIVSEFQTQEAADTYDVWSRAKYKKCLESKVPLIPLDEVKAEICATLEEHRKQKD